MLQQSRRLSIPIASGRKAGNVSIRLLGRRRDYPVKKDEAISAIRSDRMESGPSRVGQREHTRTRQQASRKSHLDFARAIRK
jgi:hypothetical protein